MSRPQATVRRVGRRPTANPKSEIRNLVRGREEIPNSSFLTPHSGVMCGYILYPESSYWLKGSRDV